MGYGQRLRMKRTADGRVLRAQLNLIAETHIAARFTAPLWALISGLLALLPVFGAVPLSRAMILPIAVALAVFLSVRISMAYRGATRAASGERVYEAWFPAFVTGQIVQSCAWGLMPWLLWQPGNPTNHLFVEFSVVSLMSWLVVSRVGHLDIFFASVVPMISLALIRLFLGDTLTDAGFGLGLLLYGVQMCAAGRRLTYRLDEDSRLRFEVEDLARELEEARDEALRKRFEAETANASKTAFLANMSHELRTPLNAILGFSEIIAKECFGAVGSPRYVEYAGDIHSSGAHLLSLINDLLDVAKIEAGRMEIQPERLDAQKTIECALKLVGAKARERRQELVIETASDAPVLFADERALKQILINLVSNAVKFTPEGGRITVVGSKARDGGFQIVVEDNGPGIPREKLDRIFKPFSQVDNRYDRQGGGTGLGLALVRGLCELHGGRAWLESDVGKGCRACIILPAAPAVSASAAA